jgi:outer membrane protein insertion porin family
VGPRVVRLPYFDDDADPFTPQVPLTLAEARKANRLSDDAIGGKAYYLGRAELEIPLGTGARELGLRPSIFADIGALFAVTQPSLIDFRGPQTTDVDGNLQYVNVDREVTTDAVAADGSPNTPLYVNGAGFREVFLGDSISPRIAVGIGVNWNSPFGPFRIDFARVLKKQEGDDAKSFTFNVGTQF